MSNDRYRSYVDTLAKRFEEALAEIQVQHNFDYGDEFEIAICKVLRRALPQRFGICRGFVAAANGQVAGDDIIIYDRLRFPTLRLLQNEDYALKELIPIEAVYAYIEAKHTIEMEGEGRSSFKYATEQIARVKEVCATREGVKHPDRWCNEDFPPILNPLFGLVLARHIRAKPNKEHVTDPGEAFELISKFGQVFPCPFDAGVLGPDIAMMPIFLNGVEGIRFSSPFFINDKSSMMHQVCIGRSFGVGLSLLLFALDWIQLGKMPWTNILAAAIMPQVDF